MKLNPDPESIADDVSVILKPTMAQDGCAAAESGETIADRYRLIEEIGSGGMGTVWVAIQSEPVRRKVAVKLIKTGMDSKAVLARFEQERQALAMMDHPNIARVFDGGMTTTGRPFFAMELVAGKPLNKFCDEAKLSIRDRLELFAPICQAVQHAHQKGIIHRDLKPANILVTFVDGRPTPKIIDFGVAKAVSGKLTDESLLTQFGAVLGTLEYMAPEQAGMTTDDIDTRADIYSLGVILYELLTGLRPFDSNRLREAAFNEVVRILREEDPPSLASRLSTDDSLPSIAAMRQMEPRRLLSTIRNELDWIVHKCLEKDRNRRYETANGLARDVQRYLSDDPVEARPITAGYRLRKFLGRHKYAAAAIGAVTLSLVGGIAGTTWGLLISQEQRRKAEAAYASELIERKRADEQTRLAEAAEAQTLADYRSATDDAIEQLIGSKQTLGKSERTFLEKSLARWKAFAARKGDTDHGLSIRAEGHHRVAALWQRLGKWTEALAEHRAALAIHDQLAARHPDEPAHRQSAAGIHHDFGTIFTMMGKYPEALASLERSLAIQRTLPVDGSSSSEYKRLHASTQHHLGAVYAYDGKSAAAIAPYEKARDLRSAFVSASPDSATAKRDLARTRHNLGIALMQSGRPGEAVKEFEAARDVKAGLALLPEAAPEMRSDLAMSHNNLGVLYAQLGRVKEAAAEHLLANALYEELVEQFPAVSAHATGLAGGYCNVGNLELAKGRPAEALLWYDRAVKLLKPIHLKEPRDAIAKFNLRNSYGGRSSANKRLRKFAETIPDLRIAADLSDGPERRDYLGGLVEMRLAAGQIAEAVAEASACCKQTGWAAEDWYAFACAYSAACVKFPVKKVEYADRAMELLAKAVAAGFNNGSHMAADADLAALRGRDDFKKLLKSVQSTASTKSVSPSPKQ